MITELMWWALMGKIVVLDAVVCWLVMTRRPRLVDVTNAVKDREALWREYHEWLGKANQGPITLAIVHGWSCPTEDVARGRDYRKRLDIEATK